MCGRYASAKHDIDLVPELQIASVVGDPPPPSWNVAPTDPSRVVLERLEFPEPDASADRQLRTLRWGLIPSWAKDAKIASRLINARIETLSEKPAFRAALGRRRCLVPADGYFEWEQLPDQKQKIPTYLHLDGQTLWFAGLYEIWRDPALPPDEPLIWTFTVITTKATDELGHIHDRSPVVVPAVARDHWLDPHADDATVAAELLASIPDPHLLVRPVSTEVNSVRNNGPQLIEPMA